MHISDIFPVYFSTISFKIERLNRTIGLPQKFKRERNIMFFGNVAQAHLKRVPILRLFHSFVAFSGNFPGTTTIYGQPISLAIDR